MGIKEFVSERMDIKSFVSGTVNFILINMHKKEYCIQ